MTRAYDEIYLGRTQKAMGDMLHFAVHDMKWDINKYYSAFISTGVSHKVETGVPKYTVGMSGYELAYDVYFKLTGAECDIKPNYVYGKSPEYFAGWSVAYYSWFRDVSFSSVNMAVHIDEVVSMYTPYHEMDITQFVEAMDEKMQRFRDESLLKRLRLYAELTQKQLAERSGVSQRMIEQYEQGRKNLSHASAESVRNLSVALGCRMEDLTEDSPLYG